MADAGGGSGAGPGRRRQMPVAGGGNGPQINKNPRVFLLYRRGQLELLISFVISARLSSTGSLSALLLSNTNGFVPETHVGFGTSVSSELPRGSRNRVRFTRRLTRRMLRRGRSIQPGRERASPSARPAPRPPGEPQPNPPRGTPLPGEPPRRHMRLFPPNPL